MGALKMGKLNQILIINLILFLTPHTLNADNLSIPNVFNTGNTISAQEMNNNFTATENAVNENNNLSLSNSQNIHSNAINIGINSTAIQTNISNIGGNSTTIQTNVSNIGLNTSAIQSNATDISNNLTDIQNNAVNIGTNSSDLSSITTAVNQLSEQITTIQTQLNALRPVLVKSNGTTLGVFLGDSGGIGPNLTVLNNNGFIMTINSGGNAQAAGHLRPLTAFPLYYDQLNCLGQVIISFNGNDLLGNTGVVFLSPYEFDSTQVYYLAKGEIPISNFNYNSRITSTGCENLSGTFSTDSWPILPNNSDITGVTTPQFSLPLTLER